MRNLIFIFHLLLIAQAMYAQTDSTSVKSDTLIAKINKQKIYSGPRKATIMSAILPGMGQVYNRKAWKVPVIYAGMGGFGYMFWFNNSQYNEVRTYLKAENDDDPNTLNTSGLSTSDLLTYKTKYRKLRDIGIIGFCAIYILNVIDANVDAHLKTFDVSDDLSVQINPWENISPNGNGNYAITGGVSLTFTWK